MRPTGFAHPRRLIPVVSLCALIALSSACRKSDTGDQTDATPSADTTALAAKPGKAPIGSASGGPAGMVWDPGAEAPVPGIRLRLVRTDTGEVVDETRSGGDGMYQLGVPEPAAVPDGTELSVEILLPPDHVFAYGYATPTPFPAGTKGPLEHHIMLVGP